MREPDVRPPFLRRTAPAALLAATLAVGACAAEPAPERDGGARGDGLPTEIQLRVASGTVVPTRTESVRVLDRSPWLQPARRHCALDVRHPAVAGEPTTRRPK